MKHPVIGSDFAMMSLVPAHAGTGSSGLPTTPLITAMEETMWRKRVFHACMRIAIVALALGSAVQASKADLKELLRGAAPAAAPQAAAPRDVLRAIRDPRPYRQTIVVDCSTEQAGMCLMRLARIPDNRLLEIATINCASGGSGSNAVILFKSGQVDETLRTVLVLMPVSPAGTLLSGPFYVNARERPLFVTSGEIGDRALCSIFGTLWRTD